MHIHQRSKLITRRPYPAEGAPSPRTRAQGNGQILAEQGHGRAAVQAAGAGTLRGGVGAAAARGQHHDLRQQGVPDAAVEYCEGGDEERRRLCGDAHGRGQESVLRVAGGSVARRDGGDFAVAVVDRGPGVGVGEFAVRRCAGCVPDVDLHGHAAASDQQRPQPGTTRLGTVFEVAVCHAGNDGESVGHAAALEGPVRERDAGTLRDRRVPLRVGVGPRFPPGLRQVGVVEGRVPGVPDPRAHRDGPEKSGGRHQEGAPHPGGGVVSRRF